MRNKKYEMEKIERKDVFLMVFNSEFFNYQKDNSKHLLKIDFSFLPYVLIHTYVKHGNLVV